MTDRPRTNGVVNMIYKLPINDPDEYARLDEQSKDLVELTKGRLPHVDLDNPTLIMEVGCGTGVTSYELAKKFPTAKIYGIDLAPAPARDDKPENLEFIVGDYRDLWTEDSRFQHGSFDLIFSRMLVCAVPNWPQYLADAKEMLKPGGWVEVQDLSVDLYENGKSLNYESNRLIQEAGRAEGLDLNIAVNAAGYMRSAGLTDVQVFPYDMPVGLWKVQTHPETERVGRTCLTHQKGVLKQLMVKMVKPNVSEAKFKALLEEIDETVVDRDGLYRPWSVTIGRRSQQ